MPDRSPLNPEELIKGDVYNAWRESEAYAVPMTELGEKLAAQRWYGFQKGWLMAKECHEDNK